MVRSVTRRIANDAAEGDAWELPELVELMALRDEADAALAEGVAALRRHGYSWAEVGAELGCSRQAAQQRFSRCTQSAPHPDPDRPDEGHSS